MAVVVVVLGLLTLLTALIKGTVIIAICTIKLHLPANYLICSLAVTDFPPRDAHQHLHYHGDVVFGSGGMRDVVERGHDLLHLLHPTSMCHRPGPVRGQYQSYRVCSQEVSPPRRHHGGNSDPTLATDKLHATIHIPSFEMYMNGQDEKSQICTSCERKAARILGLILGAFIICWLPFFLKELLVGLQVLQPSQLLSDTLTWLGYINSLINPLLYTSFNDDFKLAFKKLLKRKEHA